ncbi:hypothetical protein [Allofournierella sp. CML151]|uniref:hypothetical protein n=1 Tax=Allofournierella sp. CML151 TaxID=2998082 RepID=UPI0022EAAC19|nr:hypothetical protein [Fournierella sp. CML151]
MTKEDVRRIFDREAMIIGHSDAVPAAKAAKHFTKDALQFADRLGKSKASGLYGIGERYDTFKYYTLHGLELAATYDNISALLTN